MSSSDRMDETPDPVPSTPGDTPEKKDTGFRRALKRLRSSLKVGSSNKAVRHSDAETAGQPSSRQLESAASQVSALSLRTKTPEDLSLSRTRTPEGSSRTKTPDALSPLPEAIPPLLEIRVQAPEDPTEVPTDTPTTPPVRPILAPSSHSDGSLVNRSTRNSPYDEDTLRANAASILLRSESHSLLHRDPRDEQSMALFESYGLNLEEGGHWRPVNRPARMERVEKEPRVRLHHHCHKCTVQLNRNNQCIACGHKRCKKCTSSPHRKHRHESPRQDQNIIEASPLVASGTIFDPEKANLSAGPPDNPDEEQDILPVRRAGKGKAKIPWPPTSWSLRSTHPTPYFPFTTIHIRRLCHSCSTPFILTGRACLGCGHRMCDKCPRDPPPSSGAAAGEAQLRSPAPSSGFALTHPYSVTIGPASSPRDSVISAQMNQRMVVKERIRKAPRFRIKYTCDVCNSFFVERSLTCDKCGHQRCGNCFKLEPQPSARSSIEFDPTYVRMLENRLSTFAIIDLGTEAKSTNIVVDATPPTSQ